MERSSSAIRILACVFSVLGMALILGQDSKYNRLLALLDGYSNAGGEWFDGGGEAVAAVTINHYLYFTFAASAGSPGRLFPRRIGRYRPDSAARGGEQHRIHDRE